LYFFLVDIVLILIVPIVFVFEIEARGVVTEAYIADCVLVVLAVGVLEVDPPAGNHCDFIWYGRDTKVVGSDRSVLKISFCLL